MMGGSKCCELVLVLAVGLLFICSPIAGTDFVSRKDVDVTLPWLGMGTAGIFSETQNLVSFGLETGVRLIDTAQAKEWYDEAAVGKSVLNLISKGNNNNEVYI